MNGRSFNYPYYAISTVLAYESEYFAHGLGWRDALSVETILNISGTAHGVPLSLRTVNNVWAVKGIGPVKEVTEVENTTTNEVTTTLREYVGATFPDTDDDGLTDNFELLFNSDATNPDSDGDGLDDGQEVNIYKTSPLVVDSDRDGLTDDVEIFLHNTNPSHPDTDLDGENDGDEVEAGTDPLTPSSLGSSQVFAVSTLPNSLQILLFALMVVLSLRITNRRTH